MMGIVTLRVIPRRGKPSILVEMGRIELPSKNAAQKIFYKHSLFVC